MSAQPQTQEPLPVGCSILFISCSPMTESMYFRWGFISNVSQGCSCRVSGIQLRGRRERAVDFTLARSLVVCGMSEQPLCFNKGLFQPCVASAPPVQAGPPFQKQHCESLAFLVLPCYSCGPARTHPGEHGASVLWGAGAGVEVGRLCLSHSGFRGEGNQGEQGGACAGFLFLSGRCP